MSDFNKLVERVSAGDKDGAYREARRLIEQGKVSASGHVKVLKNMGILSRLVAIGAVLFAIGVVVGSWL